MSSDDSLDVDEDSVRRLADELSLPVDDDTIEEVLDYAADLEDTADELSESVDETQPVGVRSDDEYNALLYVYEEPRTADATGLVDGVSVAIKDNIAVRGLTMTFGLRDVSFVPSYDAVVVERLLAEGASIVGKANMDAFAFGPGGEWSEFGQVVNPIADGRIPGGSSSGSGAAVAGGLVDAALGTDTGGSVRVPAACCGLVGVKPTHRLVPRYGFTGNAPSTDVIGPLTRDVETAARMVETMAGHDPRDPTSSRVGADGLTADLDADADLTIGLVESALALVDDDVAATVRDAADRLDRRDDVTVRSVDLDFGGVDPAYSLTIGTEFAWYLRQSLTTRGEGTQYNHEWHEALSDVPFNEHIASRVLPGALIDRMTDGRSYIAGRREAIDFRRRVADLFEEVDLLLTSTLRLLPPEYGAVQTAEEGLKYSLTKPFSLTAGPAVTVPAGSVDGLPVAAQIVAPPFGELDALQLAHRIETGVE